MAGATGAARFTDPGAVRLLPYGDAAILAEVASTAAALSLYRRLLATRPVGMVDLVPAARTVLATINPDVMDLVALRSWLRAGPAADPRPSGDVESTIAQVEIPVRYTGPDLGEVATMLGVTEEEVIRRHTSSTWTVAFTGFLPGFGYLVADVQADQDDPADAENTSGAAGLDGAHGALGGAGLAVPRRATPRPLVPAGSVALAGEYSGVYPRDCPGGWNLIGTTDLVLWDPTVNAPPVLSPGASVHFVELS